MIKPFEFYFDFISPYSYLAHNEIRRIENKELIKIKYMPILLGGLHKLAGITANAFIPHKAKFMIKDCKMWAEKYKIHFKLNTYFPINSIYSWNEKIENTNEYIVIYKTTDKKIKQLRKFLEENHSYDIPEIIDFELTHTNSKYLDWLIQST